MLEKLTFDQALSRLDELFEGLELDKITKATLSAWKQDRSFAARREILSVDQVVGHTGLVRASLIPYGPDYWHRSLHFEFTGFVGPTTVALGARLSEIDGDDVAIQACRGQFDGPYDVTVRFPNFRPVRVRSRRPGLFSISEKNGIVSSIRFEPESSAPQPFNVAVANLKECLRMSGIELDESATGTLAKWEQLSEEIAKDKDLWVERPFTSGIEIVLSIFEDSDGWCYMIAFRVA